MGIFEDNATWRRLISLIQALHASKLAWQRHLRKSDNWKQIWAEQDAKEQLRIQERVEKAEQRLEKKKNGCGSRSLMETDDDTMNTPNKNKNDGVVDEDPDSTSPSFSTSLRTKNRTRLPS